MNSNITLTDLFEVDVLQRIQDAFSKMTGMAAIITDADGKPVTKGSNFTDFCSVYTRPSPLGCLRCEQCDKHGAELALKVGASVSYFCHAGLQEFAAPIMAGGSIIGCFVGGQVLTEPPDITKLMQVAAEIDVDLINYLQAALKVRIMDKTEVENAAYFLYTLTDVLSTIAYHKYEMHQANIEIEKVANLKSDFLANMSHEIRTPMNAVIGMAELALREDLNDTARDYINQIKASGKSLLTIINDILDFSKIESGKLSIIPAEYDSVSLINDVANVIATRVNKNVELLIDYNPDIPKTLIGDSIRIKQIITNISNNAAKFTQTGRITISIDFKKISSKSIDLKISVTDTGIGIKEEDLTKIFESFQQVDSKRNRNIEGTGLGLAISKQLSTLMSGDLSVESTYGKGSCFSFHMPQKVKDAEPSLAISFDKEVSAFSLLDNSPIAESLSLCLERLCIPYEKCSSLGQLKKKTKGANCYCFFEEDSFGPEYQQFVRENTHINCILFSDYDSNVSFSSSNLTVIKKPFSTINISSVFNNESADNTDLGEMDLYDYTASNASVLIVDDNKINLTVAEGLLRPVQMHVDTALSGQEAIDKISKNKYDLILMDHMMPELDGVETAHLIRRFHKDYDDVPIIALTANAVADAKEMFVKEGLNDFIAKPIELAKLLDVVKKWLPKEKLEEGAAAKPRIAPAKKNVIKIEGLDTQAALSLLGSEELFWSVLKDYFTAIPKKIATIKEYEEQELIKDYTIEVHALKSASKQIGATEVSMLALEMENAGNEKDLNKIHEKTDELLNKYYVYYEILKPLFPDVNVISDNSDMDLITDDELMAIFASLEEALDNLDMDGMEASVAMFDGYGVSPEEGELLRKLQDTVSNLDVDASEAIISEWKTLRNLQ